VYNSDEIIEILGDQGYAYSGKGPQSKRRISLVVAAVAGVQVMMLAALFFTMFLSARAFPPRLSTPQNIRIDTEQNILIWDEVDGADGYIVYINGREYPVAANYHPITFRDGQEYFLKVRAVSSGRHTDSHFSVMITWPLE